MWCALPRPPICCRQSEVHIGTTTFIPVDESDTELDGFESRVTHVWEPFCCGAGSNQRSYPSAARKVSRHQHPRCICLTRFLSCCWGVALGVRQRICPSEVSSAYSVPLLHSYLAALPKLMCASCPRYSFCATYHTGAPMTTCHQLSGSYPLGY